MGHSISFRVSGEPVPQPRPRAVSMGGHARMYGAPRDHAIHPYRDAVTLAAMAAGVRPRDGDVEILVECVFQRPPSHFKKGGGLSASAIPRPRPDWDNLVKGVQDALKGVAFADDSQVVSGSGRKRYAAEGEQEGTNVTLTWW